jgi:carbon-monoxide dehydrogenase large subunit
VIGAALRRVEDERFLAGAGQFVADLPLPGALHCVFVRSPHAHARIRSIRSQGLVFTGKDLEGLRPMRCGWVLPGMNEPPRWQMARDVVRHVGEPVAMVFAESRAAAEDLAEQVDVDYEPLPAIDGEQAFTWTRGDRAAVEQAMARAGRKVEVELVNNRLCGAAIETRGAASTGDTLYVGTQAPHHIAATSARSSAFPRRSCASCRATSAAASVTRGSTIPRRLSWSGQRAGCADR